MAHHAETIRDALTRASFAILALMNAGYKEQSELNPFEVLGTTKNGVTVSFDPVHSHAITHFEDTPQLKGLVKEVIKELEIDGRELAGHKDMGRIVGTCDVVGVDETDLIVFGMRKNRQEDGLVPFTKSRQGEPCRDVAFHLLPQSNNTYILSSAWIGTFGEDDEPFPQSPNATERSKDFWNKHAFVYGSQEIIEGTETTGRPW